jgi:hypothetical protein
MPRGYESMRDRFMDEGLDESEAKAKAARIWNSQHPNDPVTRNYDESSKSQPQQARSGDQSNVSTTQNAQRRN